MQKKIFALLAAGVLAAGCESGDSSTGMDGEGKPVPGSAADFKANVKDRVFFDYNSSKVSEEGMKTLEAQSGWFKTYPTTKAVVEGHADKRGTRAYNLALGERRANAARRGLMKHGVECGRLKTMSYGKDKPFAEGDSEEAYAQNRVAVTCVE